MPVRTGSVQDELQRLSGSTNNPFEVVTASGNGTPVYFGPDRGFMARLVIAGAVTGTNPTLDVVIQLCDDAAATNPVTVATFAQVTASQATATGSLAAQPAVPFHTTAAKPYARIVKTIGGTSTPTFNNMAVLTDPIYDVVA